LASTPAPHPENPQSADVFQLHQNTPNPFNAQTLIRFSTDTPTFVTLQILNTRGQNIRSLLSNGYPAGTFSVTWDGRDNTGRPVPSGLYLYRLQADGRMEIKRMMLIR
jgi:hypothetical protein